MGGEVNDMEGLSRLTLWEAIRNGLPYEIDDAGVALFAKAMQDKLEAKRCEGYGGWEARSGDVGKAVWSGFESHILRALLSKDASQMVDIANFAMMLWCREEMAREEARDGDDA